MWNLLITTPIWLILLFMVLNANEMPVWTWVLYWVYVPCQVLGVILVGIARAITEK